jgi:hypothetical protein
MKLSKINELINRPTIKFGKVKIIIGRTGLESEVWVNETKLEFLKSVNINISADRPTMLTLEIYNDGIEQTIEGTVEFYKGLKVR